MEEDEVEIREGSRDDYEVVPLSPIRRIERRLEDVEKAGNVPQLQNLIVQIVELIKGNQTVVNEVLAANASLRNELSRVPPKIDELTVSLKRLINLIEAAGRDEVTAPGPEAMKPLNESFQKMLDMNQKMLENNEAMMEALDSINKKMKSGTPVSQLLSSYPSLKIRKEG